MADPHVSVVVPVRNRRPLLAQLLDALAAQTYRDFELIVVDDGSTDGADAVARAEARFAVTVVANDAAGAVAARSRGVACARGEVLAFTDSDCAPAPGWIAAGTAAIDAGADVAAGPTVSAAPRRLLERSLANGDNGLYPTSNVFYRRAAFDAAGGFDAAAARRLGFRAGARARGLGFGEDTLLGWRVRRRGRAAYVPDATVAHAVFPPDLRDHFSRTAQAGGFPALVREVPELRDTLLARRLFLGSTSRLPLYCAAVLSPTRASRAIALALTVWAVRHAWRIAQRHDPLKRKLLAYPVVLASDALTAGALVAGSARARTLVL